MVAKAHGGESSEAGKREAPRLVLQITVDALRGDLPGLFLHEMGDGGFRFLLAGGIHYENARFAHANTDTIVGHTSLATGTVPAGHGMVGNVWYDRELERTFYNIEDPDYVLLTAGADVDAATEIDPTQRTAKVEGRSPIAILSPTLSDQLTIATQGRARVFSVSVKDRAAVSMAGHTGKAFWFSKATGGFVTSSYYYNRYPTWVEKYQADKRALQYAGKAWELMNERASYIFGERDDQVFELDFPGFGRTFPHPYGEADDKYLSTRLTLGPAGDRLTLEFAKVLMLEEKLGQDDVPDYLAISFSSTDYIAHIFGPSSLELEDNMLQLDRVLAELFAFVEESVGLNRTLIVLSADHGTPEVPGFLNELGFKRPRYFDVPAVESPLFKGLIERYGMGEELIESYTHPYIYLNHSTIKDAGLELAEVEAAVTEILHDVEGLSAAISSSALRTGSLPDNKLTRAVRRNFHPKRSGDIYLVFEPNVFINAFDGMEVASTHGSPWHHDTFVPVIFAGAGLEPRRVSRPVAPYDIAATLAVYLGIVPPPKCIGEALPEVLGR